MLKSLNAKLSIFIILLICFLLNTNFFSIKITTLDYYEDKVLTSFIKENNQTVFNMLVEKNLYCNCLISYEKDVSDSLRFKIFSISDPDYKKVSYEINSLFLNLIKNYEIEQNKNAELIFEALQRLILADKININHNDNKLLNELINNTIKTRNLESFKINYLKSKYSNVDKFRSIKNEIIIPTYQIKFLLNIILIFILLIKIRSLLLKSNNSP